MKNKKMMKNNTIILIIGFITCILLGCFMWYNQTPREVIKTDTVTVSDTIYKTDTFKIEKLVPKKVVEIKRDTLYKKDSTEVILVSENKEYKDTISTNDGDSIILNNYISGINPQLDSTKVNLKKKEIIKTVQITKYIEKKKTIWDRFHISLQGGYGYGFNYKGFEPYVGIGGSFDL